MEAVLHHGRANTLKMGLLQTIFSYLVICSLFHSFTCCSVFEVQYGNVTDDQDLNIGSPLHYWCSLFPETVQQYGVTSQDLILKVGSRVLQTYPLNNYTIAYDKDEAFVNDTGFYKCFVPIPEYEKPQLVCASSISVGTAPKEVSNFSCIGYNFINLSCSWIPPRNKVQTKYELHDYLSNDPRLIRKCPLPNVKSSSCQFGVETKPPYFRRQEVLNFILKGENSLGTITQYFSIRHYEIVKPGEPSKVSFKNVTRDSLVIEILAPKGLEYGEFPYGLVYEITYYSVSTKLKDVKVARVANSTNAELEIKDLVPNTQYKFEVRCRLNITGDHYFMSNVVNVTEITKPDVPYLAPEVDASSFDLLQIENEATITLYWKAVPSEFENGDKFHYIIKYHEYHVPSRRKREAKTNSVRVANSTTYTFKDLDKNTAYLFTIVAANEVGPSVNQSAVIVVDAAKKLLPGPKDITVVLYNEGYYDMSWKSLDPEINSFTIAACETLKSRPAKCEGPISYFPVENRTYHKFSDLNPRTNYQFAVAAAADGRTSGLHWAPCIVTYGVLYEVKMVKLFPKTSTSLRVTWSYICPAIARVIREVEIAMCPSQEVCSAANFERCSVNEHGISGWPPRRISNSTTTDLVIGDLLPFRQYYAVVRVRTDAGWGAYSGFGCESTMPSAPSDPPSDVYAEIQPVQDSMKASIRVSYEPPNIPNGIISRYVVYYNNTSSSEGKEKEVRVQDNNRGTSTVLDNILYHTNYSIQVTACVEQACSPFSEPLFLYTGISNPGIINLPRVEMREKDVNISWDFPALANGPLDYYQILMTCNESNIEMVYNVSGHNYMLHERSCDTEDADKNQYEFRIRAINVKDGMPFYGDYSNPLQTMLCSVGISAGFYVGVILGSLLAVAFFAGLCYYGYKWGQNNIIQARNTQVKLPKALEPKENPLSTFDEFKGCIKKKSHDSGIAYERGYERFYEPAAQDGNNTENTNQSGEQSSDQSIPSDQNCFDSISSATTVKTHSIDSGAEIESPPSPDSCSSDAGSAHTTPRTFEPGLNIVNEISNLASRDSGLENPRSVEDCPINQVMEASGGADPTFRGMLRCNTPPYVPRNEQNLIDTRSLSNSEPSVVDFEDEDGTEPLVNPVMHPYSKFGLARSASNGINLSHETQRYSKFGMIYRTLKTPPDNQTFDQQVFHANTTHQLKGGAAGKDPELPPGAAGKDPELPPGAAGKDPELPPGAYSKFGVEEAPKPSHYVAVGSNGASLPHFAYQLPSSKVERTSAPGHPYCRVRANGWDTAESLPYRPPYTNPPPYRHPPPPYDHEEGSGECPTSHNTPDDQSPPLTGVNATDPHVLPHHLTGGQGFEVQQSDCEAPAVVHVDASLMPATSGAKSVNYAFRKTCNDVSELLRCINDGCLPELVVKPGTKAEAMVPETGPDRPVPNVYVLMTTDDMATNAQASPQSNHVV